MQDTAMVPLQGPIARNMLASRDGRQFRHSAQQRLETCHAGTTATTTWFDDGDERKAKRKKTSNSYHQRAQAAKKKVSRAKWADWSSQSALCFRFRTDS